MVDRSHLRRAVRDRKGDCGRPGCMCDEFTRHYHLYKVSQVSRTIARKKNDKQTKPRRTSPRQSPCEIRIRPASELFEEEEEVPAVPPPLDIPTIMYEMTGGEEYAIAVVRITLDVSISYESLQVEPQVLEKELFGKIRTIPKTMGEKDAVLENMIRILRFIRKEVGAEERLKFLYTLIEVLIRWKFFAKVASCARRFRTIQTFGTKLWDYYCEEQKDCKDPYFLHQVSLLMDRWNDQIFIAPFERKMLILRDFCGAWVGYEEDDDDDDEEKTTILRDIRILIYRKLIRKIGKIYFFSSKNNQSHSELLFPSQIIKAAVGSNNVLFKECLCWILAHLLGLRVFQTNTVVVVAKFMCAIILSLPFRPQPNDESELDRSTATYWWMVTLNSLVPTDILPTVLQKAFEDTAPEFLRYFDRLTSNFKDPTKLIGHFFGLSP